MTENPQKDAKAQLKAAKAYAKASRPWYKMKRTWLVGLVAIFAIFMALNQGGGGTSAAPAAGGNANQPAAAEKAKPLVVTADKLIDDLDSNALKAANTYKDKYVQVKGKVSNIDSSGDYFSVARLDDEISFTSIRMDIEEEHRSKVEAFETDQTVTVTGTVKDVGEVMGYSIDVESIS